MENAIVFLKKIEKIKKNSKKVFKMRKKASNSLKFVVKL